MALMYYLCDVLQMAKLV